LRRWVECFFSLKLEPQEKCDTTASGRDWCQPLKNSQERREGDGWMCGDRGFVEGRLASGKTGALIKGRFYYVIYLKLLGQEKECGSRSRCWRSPFYEKKKADNRRIREEFWRAGGCCGEELPSKR